MIPPLLLCLLLPVATLAQPSHGYFAVGLGSSESKTTSQAASGGEWMVAKGWGFGGELGVLAGHDSFGFFSGNGYYHLPVSRASDRRLDPFVTGGGGVALRVFGNSAGLVNFGGGVNYWFLQRLGVRLEIRDMVAPDSFDSRHFWGFRFGLAFH